MREGNLAGLVRELKARLGPEKVLTSPASLLPYSRDASPLAGRAGAVVLAEEREDVRITLELASRYGVPFTPRGAGTSLSGGAVPAEGSVVVSTSRMRRVLEVRAEERTAWVEPGVTGAALSEVASRYGLAFAPDPSSGPVSTVGGNVAHNAGGAHCLAAGATSSHVLAVEMVLPGGEVVLLGGEAPALPGPDLRSLAVGSEGTLGVITAILVRLVPAPRRVLTYLAAFEGVREAAEAVSAVIASGVIPSAMEIMDRGIVLAVEEYSSCGYPTWAEAVVLVELAGEEGEVEEGAARVLEILGARAAEVRTARSEEEREALWRGRKMSFGTITRIRPNHYLHDVVVPRTRMPDVLEKILEAARAEGLEVVNNFHAGDGNLHPILLFDGATPGVWERVARVGEEIMRAAVEAGGALSGEHGIGLEKREFMSLVFSREDLVCLARVKGAFDPEGLANPGKVFPPGGPLGSGGRGQGSA